MARTGVVVAAVAAGALVIGGAYFIRSGGEDDAPAAAAVEVREGCELLTVASSSEKAALLSGLADEYNGEARGDASSCVTVTVESAASGDMEAALVDGWNADAVAPGTSRPDVWTPASTTWLNLLAYDQSSADRAVTVPDAAPSITQTPLVIAMPQPMAEALGWPGSSVGWNDIEALAANADGWGSVGHPEWGRFTLGKTNPYISTSGLAATITQLVAATGKSSDLTSADVADPAVQARLATVENAVEHYGDTTLTFLSNLLAADDRGRGLSYISAVAVEEKSVHDYNIGNPSGDPATVGDHEPPTVPLVAIYPEDGSLVSDSPYAVLDADWVTAQQRAGAEDFYAWLTEPEQQSRFTDAGFRPLDNSVPADLAAAGTAVAQPSDRALSYPSGRVLNEARAVWDEQRKRARVLLLLDVSGSMDEPASGNSGISKMELAKQAASQSLDGLEDTDEVGLWVFTTNLDGGRVYEELAPVAPLGSGRDAITSAIASLQPRDGTPLYAAAEEAYDAMTPLASDDFITGVVLLTDGVNEYNGGPSLDDLTSELSRSSIETGVRIFTIAYGDGADTGVLAEIATATRARAYDATNAESINRVFRSILSNF